jgi:peptide/nickel transport system permease protein
MLDHTLQILTVAGLAMASFWLALILQLVFAMDSRRLPLQAALLAFTWHVTGFHAGRRDSGRRPIDWSMRCPSMSASADTCDPALATVVRFTRAGVLDTLQKPFVTYQTAIGIPRAVVVWKYVLRNALHRRS